MNNLKIYVIKHRYTDSSLNTALIISDTIENATKIAQNVNNDLGAIESVTLYKEIQNSMIVKLI